MGIELPPISAKIGADIGPLRESFQKAIQEAKNAAKEINQPVIPKIETTKLVDETKQAAKQMRDELENALAPKTARFSPFEQGVRDSMAKQIKAMRDAAIRSNVSEEAQLRLYGPKQAEADVVQFEETVQTMKAESVAASTAIGEATGGGILKGLNSQFGRGSSAGMLARLITGGGPILAIGLITNALKSATEQASNLVTQFRAGEIDAGQTTVKIAESIPIIGNVASAIANVHEICTGYQASLKAANDEAARMADLSKAISASFASADLAVKSIKGDIARLNVDRSLINASPLVKEMVGIGRKAASEISGFEGPKLDPILNPSGRASFADLQTQLKNQRRQLELAFIPAAVIQQPAENVNRRAWGSVTNQQEINAAIEKRKKIVSEIAETEREITGRQVAADRVSATLGERRLGVARNAASELAKLLKDTGKNALHAIFTFPTTTDNSPFDLIRDAKQAAQTMIRNAGQHAAILGGRFDSQDWTESMMKARREGEILSRVDTSGMLDFRDRTLMSMANADSLHARMFGRSGGDDSELIQHLFSALAKFDAGRAGDAAGSGSKAATDAATNTKNTVDVLKSIDRKLDFQVVSF